MIDRLTIGPLSFRPEVRTGQASVTGSMKNSGQNSATASSPVLVRLADMLVKQGPPVDYAKIAQLRQAIASGKYEIDPKSIAREIIGFGKAD